MNQTFNITFCLRGTVIIRKGAFADGDGREMIVQCAFENMDVSMESVINLVSVFAMLAGRESSAIQQPI